MMNAHNVDDLARTLATGQSRRTLLKTMAGGIFGLGGLAVARRADAAIAPTTVTIHKAACSSAEAGDPYGNCHDHRMAGVIFGVPGDVFQTDANGVLTFLAAPGSITIEESSDFRTDLGAYVYCSDTDTGDVLFNGDAVKGAITFTGKAGQNVVCDWYNIYTPETKAVVTIHKAGCPVSETDDVYGNCHDNGWGGVWFDLNGYQDMTDGDGVVSFALPAGKTTITEGDPFLTGSLYAYCRDLVSDTVLFDGHADTGVFAITTTDGMDVVCDIYNIYEEPAGPPTVTIHKATCPANLADDLYGNCHGKGAKGIEIVVGGTLLTTDAKGVASTEVEAGDVTIAENPDDLTGALYAYCRDTVSNKVLFDGRADEGMFGITVKDGMAVVCDLYNITEAEEGEEPETPTLPETGTGGSNAGLLAGAAVIAGAAALLGKALRPETDS